MSAVTVLEPIRQRVPVVFSSPHSGAVYPSGFLEQLALPAAQVRSSADMAVDILYDFIPTLGAPLLTANFPRVYVDVNRAVDEIDQELLPSHTPWPGAVQHTQRVQHGLGVIPRINLQGQALYKRALSVQEIQERITVCYTPYHQELQGCLAKTVQNFGRCLLIDCHSMPSVGSRVDMDTGSKRPDIVLSDNHGRTCQLAYIDLLKTLFQQQGLSVSYNKPYSGGYITCHYAAMPQVETLQIEISRQLYMHERDLTLHAGFKDLQNMLFQVMATFLQALSDKQLQAAE